MSNAKFVTGADALHEYRDDVLSGKPPTFYKVGSGELERIEVAPKQITMFGGAPGSGKTAFVMQCVFDALRLDATLRAVVCNIEMPPSVLLDRQLARLSGVSLKTIRYRAIEAHQADRIDAAMNTIDEISERLCFVRPPFDLGNIAATADEFAPLGNGNGLLLVFDYIQRIGPPGVHNDKRGSIDATMNYLRQFADAGAALIVVASVGRTKDNRGRSSYDGDFLDLASFKESGELEFGADDAFILAPDKKMPGVRVLKHLKSRHGECRDLYLRFDGARQSFEPIADQFHNEQPGGLSSALADAWNGAEPARGEPWQP